METFFVEPEYTDMRIDRYLSEIYPEKSRSFFQKLIKAGQVLVNQNPVKTSCLLDADDEISVDFPEPEAFQAVPENIPLSIVYEDSDVILVNKPQGMVVHPAPGHMTGTLVNALLYHCTDLSGINGVMRPGIVHRIDRDTAGILIVCKNDASHNAIAAQLKAHSSKRKYTALVEGNVKEDEGTVDAPVGRSRKDRKRMDVVPDGKRAVTHYRVLKRFNGYTLIECVLETGRTHQIRVHMAHIRHPLVNDPLYNPHSSPFWSDGQMLVACLFGFVHPSTGEYMEFTVELPDYFKEALKKLENMQ